jgi:predicted Co/Zn/Cd cation transporter (cation efflux family)
LTDQVRPQQRDGWLRALRLPTTLVHMVTSSQVWVLLGILGVLSTGLIAAMGFAFAILRGEMSARFDGVDGRFDGVDKRLDSLDRDVQGLTERFFRDRP